MQLSATFRSRLRIGLLTPTVQTGYANRLATAVERAVQSLGADFFCFVGGYFTDGGRASSRYDGSFVYDLARNRSVDGLVVPAAMLADGVGIDYLRAFCMNLGVPLVAVGKVPGFPHVLSDQATGLRAMLEHLIVDHHRRRFAFIRGCVGNPDAEERESAFRSVLELHGIPIREELILPGDFVEASGVLAVRELFDQRRIRMGDVEAIVAGNDRMASGAIDELVARGVAVPQDIAVVGFDDDDSAGFTEPPLTTVSQQVEHLGQKAVDVLLSLLLGRDTPERVLVDTVPVLRRSCGCVRRSYSKPQRATAQSHGTWALPDAFRTFCRKTVVRQFGLDEAGHDRGSETLVEALEQALRGAEVDLDPFTHVVLTTANNGDDPLRWREVLLLAEAELDRSDTADLEILDRVKWVLSQAHLAVAEVAARAQRREQQRSTLVSTALQVLDCALVSAEDEDAFARILEVALPALGFGFCCVCLFQDVPPERSHARAIVVLDAPRGSSLNFMPDESEWWGLSHEVKGRSSDARTEAPAVSEVFPTENLFPPEMGSNDVPAFVSVHPLAFGRKPLGYAVFDQPWRYGPLWTSSALADNLSSAVSVLHQAQHLRRARQTAEAASAAKSEFVARMSHEIRTPLTAIMGYLDLCLGRITTPDERRYLTQAQASSKVLLGVINDVLDFSKIEARKLEVERTTFDLEEVLDQIIATASGAAYGKSIELVLDVSEEVSPMLVGDPLRITQVLINLVSNAIKFTAQGEVVLAIECAAGSANSTAVRFSVRDTGIGMAPEHLARLTDPFVQADSSTTRRYGGTGLGLAISRRLIHRMGGTLSIESTEGKGTECSFSLPCSGAGVSTRSASVPLHDWPDAQVLVVDDNLTSLQVVSRMLRQRGCRVETAEKGEAAIERMEYARANGESLDLLVIDQGLPGLTGCDVVQRLRHGNLIGDCHVLIMQPLGQSEPSVGLLCGTACGSLSKPVRRRELSDRIACARTAPRIPMSARTSETSDLRPLLADKCVLLVQDDEINRVLAKEILESVGMIVQTVENGLQAVNRFADLKLDAVLMDLDLPDIDGCEATRRIRQLAGGAALPILAVTASSDPDDRQRCLNAGMNDCLQTPVDSRHMLIVLAKWLGRDPTAPGVTAASSGPARLPVGVPAKGTEKAHTHDDWLDVPGALVRLRGDAALYRRLLRRFLETHGATAQHLQYEPDPQACLRSVHTLGGAAANIGAVELHRAANDLERKLRARDAGAISAWRRFERALSETLPMIAAAVRESTTAPSTPTSVDRETLRAQLATLSPLLDRCDVAAVDVVDSLPGLIGPGALNEELRRIERAVRGYDFEGAARRVQTLLTSIE